MIDWPIQKIETHRADALARLTSQYAHAEKLRSLIGISADRIQGLEDALQQILRERWVNEAIGDQLDELGAIVGEERLNRNDRQYRPAIRLRIELNRSGGEPESVIRFVERGFGADIVDYREIYPAKIEVYARLGEEGAGTELIEEDFALDDGSLLQLSDGNILSVITLDRQLFADQIQRVRDVVAAGVGTVFFTETDTLIAFGISEVSADLSLELSDGSTFELSDGSELKIIDSGEISDPPEYIAGLGELGVAEFELSLNDEFALELDSGETLGVTDQVDFIEGTQPRGALAELFEVA